MGTLRNGVAALWLCSAAGLVVTGAADACSCAGPSPADDGERPALAAGARAFIGTVVSKRRVDRGSWPEVFAYRVRVRRSFNVRLGRTLRLESQVDGGTCGFEWRRGERVAGFLYGRRGRWGTGSCSLSTPRDLLRDSKPYPRPLRDGRVAMLAFGGFSGARTMALDRRGRILGYGFGSGSASSASVCPGSGAAVEAGHYRRGRPLLVTRDLSTLAPTANRRQEAFALRCMSASGRDIVLAAGGLQDEAEIRARFRLVRLLGGVRRRLRTGVASALVLSPRFAFTLEGRLSRQLIATDLGNGRARRLLRLPGSGGELAVSPDGTRVALLLSGAPERPRRAARLGVVDLNGPRPRLRLRRLGSPFAGGRLLWEGNEKLLRLASDGSAPRVHAYTPELRPLGRFGLHRGGPATLLGERLLEIHWGVLRSVGTPGRAGRRIRGLPTDNTSVLLAVPGEPRIFAGPRRPTPRRPVVRPACRRARLTAR